MCGICGIVSRESNYPISQHELLVMRDSLEHRGPDDAGHYLGLGVGLGSRRLSILDLSERAHMPMSTEGGRYWITYNGEVYNFRQLRTELEARGYRFRSNSDTEVVLNAYAEYGPAMLARFNGMFAFAIWDERERTLFLARDRVGVKPLYYAERNGTLYFASEEKALFAAGINPEFDHDTWEELLCFRYVAGERTPYVGVKRLLPGHYLMWKDGRSRTVRWWHLGERAQNLSKNPHNAASWFRETFDDAVNSRRISDVPVGVLLSGGLDSSSVAASLAQQSGSPVASFTVRFKESRYDEGPLAREVANRWKLDHHELIVSPDELFQRLHRASRLNDEPLVHGNDLHLWSISEYAKPLVTVLLSGEGGDETLGGYVRYRPLRHPALFRAARPVFPTLVSTLGLNGRLKKLSRFFELGSLDSYILFNSCEVLPDDLVALGMRPTLDLPFRRQVLAEARGFYPKDPFRQAMYSDQHTFICSILDRNDRMTMGASIECRVPFLDYRLMEGLAALPTPSLLVGRQNKQLLRQAVGERLPEAIHKHPKWGFAVPWTSYLRQVADLRNVVEELPNVAPLREGPFDRSLLRNAVRSFMGGDDRYEMLIKQLVMITIWHQACFLAPPATIRREAQSTNSAPKVQTVSVA
jgi:asparagine synthase (glutamine-hydrolysing)